MSDGQTLQRTADDPLKSVRLVSLLEGLSFLVLLLVAMPLKYGLGMPMAVRIVGSLHGFLFVALVLVLATATFQKRLSSTGALTVFGLGLVPFGFLLAERSLRSTPVGTT